MKKFSLLIALVYSCSTLGFTIPDVYHSGVEVCDIYKSQIGEEFEKWIEVPVDYSNPDGENTQIYAYTKKPFNKDLPSVIYFTGGPGVSSRGSEFDLPNSNLIFFEQRGTSCSRPNTKELFLNPKFYSSENTAKDALRIIKSYGIKKVASYGQSYGTVPATIFASIFPQYTSSLIIEGVIYEGGKTLWSSEVKQYELQHFFDALPKDKQDRIITLSTNGFFPANWYSKLGGMMLYMNNGMETFKEFLDNTLSMDDETLKSFVGNFYPEEKPEDEFNFGDVTMGMIGCQEISMNDPSVSLTLIFEGRKLIYDQNNIDREQRCKPLHLENVKTNYYKATNYPVTVPAFYLLGETDGATDLNQGMNHFKNVAKGQKTMLLMKKGGHLPSLGLLKDNYPCDPEKVSDHCDSLKQNVLMTKIFEGIIANKKIEADLVSTFNDVGPLFWSIRN